MATCIGVYNASASDVTKPITPPKSASEALSPKFEIPANAIYVSTEGNDVNTGSKSAPLRTITKAIASVPSDGTIIVRGGTYREGSSAAVWKTATIQNYPGEEVWMDGTDVVTNWKKENAVWTTSWSTPSFCDGKYYDRPYLKQSEDNKGPCTHVDMARDPGNPAAGDPQMTFINNQPLKEVTSATDLRPGTFYYDQQQRKMYLADDPSNKVVELAARPNAIALEAGNTFTIRGIGFRRYATNEFNENRTHGAVLVNSPNVTLDRLAFTGMAGAGITVADPRNFRLSNSFLGNNGFNGLDANGHFRTGKHDGLIIENNTFAGNNTELFGTNCDISCAAAGIKMAHLNGGIIRGNVFQDGQGAAHGYWCDIACSNVVIVSNVFRHNGGAGIFYEVSDTGIIASNVIEQNGKYGIKLGSANTKVYNNTLNANGVAMLVYDDDRTLGVGGWSDVGPDTVNVDIANNLVIAGSSSDALMQFWRTSSKTPNTGPNTFVRLLNSNSYVRPKGNPTTLFEWRDGKSSLFKNLEELRAKGFEIDSTEGNVVPTQGKLSPIPIDVLKATGYSTEQFTRYGAVETSKQTPSSTSSTIKPQTTQTVKTDAFVEKQGFEQSSAKWRQFGSARLSTTSEIADSGTKSLRIDAPKTRTITGATESPVSIQSTIKGKTYTGQCRVTSENSIRVRVRFQEYDHNWKRLEAPHDGAPIKMTGNQEWHTVQVRYTAKTTGAQLPFTVYSTDMVANSKPFYVDSCEITSE